ncbi:LysR family transcriptional regulator [Limosilactobacillus fermentum]|uniref:LysR family transcriptional regulator n=1 Tax=Limosilactobacillus fermentum TaxID=1613 RepID=UPI00202651BB|nr:LysR family transcriptional regulator [Limosilactobacillus fermentum]URL83252.1 LysR family transcriptional regulator [Limosilactobacillus fermentum]
MKQINKLEQELGVALFTRTSTGVTLTPAGKGFKGYAEQIVNLVNQALVASHQYSGQRQVDPAEHFFDAPQRPLHGHLEPD